MTNALEKGGYFVRGAHKRVFFEDLDESTHGSSEHGVADHVEIRLL
jgi:hypothetical protein